MSPRELKLYRYRKREPAEAKRRFLNARAARSELAIFRDPDGDDGLCDLLRQPSIAPWARPVAVLADRLYCPAIVQTLVDAYKAQWHRIAIYDDSYSDIEPVLTGSLEAAQAQLTALRLLGHL